jgi:hypothetical protein
VEIAVSQEGKPYLANSYMYNGNFENWDISTLPDGNTNILIASTYKSTAIPVSPAGEVAGQTLAGVI